MYHFHTTPPKYCSADTPLTSKSTSGASVTCSSLRSQAKHCLKPCMTELALRPYLVHFLVDLRRHDSA